jgi:hypothetical protein
VQPQDGLDDRRFDPMTAAGETFGDPGGLGSPLQVRDVLLAPPAVHGHDGHEPAARDEAHEQQPPLELRHQGGRIGRDHGPGGRAAHTLGPR